MYQRKKLIRLVLLATISFVALLGLHGCSKGPQNNVEYVGIDSKKNIHDYMTFSFSDIDVGNSVDVKVDFRMFSGDGTCYFKSIGHVRSIRTKNGKKDVLAITTRSEPRKRHVESYKALMNGRDSGKTAKCSLWLDVISNRDAKIESKDIERAVTTYSVSPDDILIAKGEVTLQVRKGSGKETKSWCSGRQQGCLLIPASKLNK